jgi:hypothetical protein
MIVMKKVLYKIMMIKINMIEEAVNKIMNKNN